LRKPPNRGKAGKQIPRQKSHPKTEKSKS